MIGSTIVIATTNQGKAAEFRAGLAGLGLQIQSLSDYPDFGEIKEDGTTFSANALIKARAAYEAIGRPCLADDSGLEVDALDGAPGVRSHRFAGPAGDDAANNALLLAKLRNVPLERRQARFRSALALIWAPGQELTIDGTCEGVILEAPRGQNGFGYDPLFYIEELGSTMAELPLEMKNKISHRGRAIAKLRQVLLQQQLIML